MAATEYEAVPAVGADAERPAADEARAGIVVMKFGGTSVADPGKLKSVARRLVRAREAGSSVVGVLSAMGIRGRVWPHPVSRGGFGGVR